MKPRPLNQYSRALADAVGAVLDEDEFPVVLGGDGSILLGTMLALHRRGRYGPLYIDGDADFYQPAASPLRGAASASDLALATGRGPDVVADIQGPRPLVRDEDVCVSACRDAGLRRLNSPVRQLNPAADHGQGLAAGASEPAARSWARGAPGCASSANARIPSISRLACAAATCCQVSAC